MLSKKLENFLQDKQRTRQVLHLFFFFGFLALGKRQPSNSAFFSTFSTKKKFKFQALQNLSLSTHTNEIFF
jgi:hypothetical protein